jgi:hypothetical protein
MQNLSQEELYRGDGHEPTVPPRGRPDLTAHAQTGVGLQQRGPLACKPLQDGRDTCAGWS